MIKSVTKPVVRAKKCTQKSKETKKEKYSILLNSIIKYSYRK